MPSSAWCASSRAQVGARCRVGIGHPGAISPATGLVKNANSTRLNGQPLDVDLKHALGRDDVRLSNDANCFAVSEASDGAGAGAPIVFGVILGTGVGGGIVIDGKPLVGAQAIAGEWGHNALPLPRDDERPGPHCYCGRKGCVEAWLSGPPFQGQYRAARPAASCAPPISPRPRQRASQGRSGVPRALLRSPRALRSPTSSTCSIRTSSCWAAACRRSRSSTSACPNCGRTTSSPNATGSPPNCCRRSTAIRAASAAPRWLWPVVTRHWDPYFDLHSGFGSRLRGG